MKKINKIIKKEKRFLVVGSIFFLVSLILLNCENKGEKLLMSLSDIPTGVRDTLRGLAEHFYGTLENDQARTTFYSFYTSATDPDSTVFLESYLNAIDGIQDSTLQSHIAYLRGVMNEHPEIGFEVIKPYELPPWNGNSIPHTSYDPGDGEGSQEIEVEIYDGEEWTILSSDSIPDFPVFVMSGRDPKEPSSSESPGCSKAQLQLSPLQRSHEDYQLGLVVEFTLYADHEPWLKGAPEIYVIVGNKWGETETTWFDSGEKNVDKEDSLYDFSDYGNYGGVPVYHSTHDSAVCQETKVMAIWESDCSWFGLDGDDLVGVRGRYYSWEYPLEWHDQDNDFHATWGSPYIGATLHLTEVIP